jgi:hypothetical protein
MSSRSAKPFFGGEPFGPLAAFWAGLSTGRLTLEVSHRDSLSESSEDTL